MCSGALNGKSFITNALESTNNKECDFNEPHVQQRPPVDVFKKVLGNVSLKPGKVVGLTILTQKGFFSKEHSRLKWKIPNAEGMY